MNIRGLLFDVNGTMIDIHTRESYDEIYRTLSNLLSYQGIAMSPASLKSLYFQTMNEQRIESGEHHPEFDAVGVFRKILKDHATDFTRRLPAEKLSQLPVLAAEVYRAASLFKLDLYRGVKETLGQLRGKYLMGIVSDGQSAWAIPELNAVGLLDYFNPIFVSSDFSYRKPDRRLFDEALKKMAINASEALFIGNDMHHDIYGAQRCGLKTVFINSNQGKQENDGVEPDYIIYRFPELLNAIQFFEEQ